MRSERRGAVQLRVVRAVTALHEIARQLIDDLEQVGRRALGTSVRIAAYARAIVQRRVDTQAAAGFRHVADDEQTRVELLRDSGGPVDRQLLVFAARHRGAERTRIDGLNL